MFFSVIFLQLSNWLKWSQRFGDAMFFYCWLHGILSENTVSLDTRHLGDTPMRTLVHIESVRAAEGAHKLRVVRGLCWAGTEVGLSIEKPS